MIALFWAPWMIWATPARIALDYWTALRFDPGRRQ